MKVIGSCYLLRLQYKNKCVAYIFSAPSIPEVLNMLNGRSGGEPFYSLATRPTTLSHLNSLSIHFTLNHQCIWPTNVTDTLKSIGSCLMARSNILFCHR